MKLLICTQKIDLKDDNLGFFHGWVAEFAKHCEEVTVIALTVGEHDLPSHVRVLSLGKERGRSRLKYLWNFYRFVIRERAHYDSVFVHMNTEYVVLSGILWRRMGKKIGLWYTHKEVNIMLRIAEYFADVVFTASVESFRLPSAKVKVMGHGIDTEYFASSAEKKDDAVFRIVSIGRISPVKNYEILIDAVSLLDVSPKNIEVLIVGGPSTREQETYFRELQSRARRSKYADRIFFVGAVPNTATLPYLHGAHIFVNMSRTGSLDKAVLEAMSVGVPVLTSNDGLGTTLKDFREQCMFPEGDARALATYLHRVMAMSQKDREELGRTLRGVVEKSHNMSVLIPRILQLLD